MAEKKPNITEDMIYPEALNVLWKAKYPTKERERNFCNR